MSAVALLSTVAAVAPEGFCESATGPAWTYKLNEPVRTVAVAGDSSLVVIGSDNDYAYAFDRTGNKLWDNKTNWNAYRVAVSNDGSVIAVSSYMGATHIKDRQGNRLGEYSPASAYTSGLAISGAGDIAAIGCMDGWVYVFDNKGGLIWKDRAGAKGGFGMQYIAMSGNGNTIASGGPMSALFAYDRAGNKLWEREVNGSIVAVAVSDNGETIAAGTFNDTLYVFDRQGTLRFSFLTNPNHQIEDVAVSSEGNAIVVASSRNIIRFDRSGSAAWDRQVDDWLSCLAMSPDGNVIMAGTDSGKVLLFGGDGVPAFEYAAVDEITSVAVADDKRLIVAGSKDNAVYVFNNSNDRLVPTPAPQASTGPTPSPGTTGQGPATGTSSPAPAGGLLGSPAFAATLIGLSVVGHRMLRKRVR